ncbi:formylglycine-generating enzyme family protein [Verrucomicrobia bacterium]|nr:formylglycine-generating enzyme family protein [Verrucomicrobiota bacterium]
MAQEGVIEAQLSQNPFVKIVAEGPAGFSYEIQKASLPNWNWVKWKEGVFDSPKVSFSFNTRLKQDQFFKLIIREPEKKPEQDLMVFIPEGSFKAGIKQNDVFISAMFIDQHEVTLGLWRKVRDWGLQNGYTDLPEGVPQSVANSRHHTYPATNMNWAHAAKWCNARSEMEGLKPAYFKDSAKTRIYRLDFTLNFYVDWRTGYRLPTSAEWEKASRAGKVGLKYPWGNDLDPKLANYNKHIMAVGQFPPNEFGLYDMAGNVEEWCYDWWQDPEPEFIVVSRDPKGLPMSSRFGRFGQRTSRGGSWLQTGGYMAHDFVHNRTMGTASDFIGFRAVLPYEQ